TPVSLPPFPTRRSSDLAPTLAHVVPGEPFPPAEVDLHQPVDRLRGVGGYRRRGVGGPRQRRRVDPVERPVPLSQPLRLFDPDLVETPARLALETAVDVGAGPAVANE